MPIPFNITKLRVDSLDVDFHEISWSLSASTFDVLDFQFQVLRAESPEGPFDELTPPFEDRYTFVDNILQVAHRWRQYHYQIRVIEKATGDVKEFGPVAHEPEPDLVALELRRHIRLLMREFAGRRCIILPVRTFGQRCTDCWHPVLDKRTKSGCITCYDTGFVRGYLYPIETFVQMDPSSKSQQHINTGETQQDNTTARFGYYPQVKPYDVLVEPENVRWRVVEQTQTEHSRAAVHQEVKLHRIPEKDIEYAIPVHFGQELKNLWVTPSRNYTNPHNLSNFEQEEIPGIFALYPSTYPRRT